MMKKILFTGLLCGMSLFGADYSAMSLDDLLLQKGSVPEADRESFKSAMQSKMGELTPEERANIQHGSGKGEGSKQYKKQQSNDRSYGSGSGQMKKQYGKNR